MRNGNRKEGTMKKIAFLFFVTTVLSVGLLVPGMVPAKGVPGVTDDTIVIGQWGPQTGPAALWGAVARGTDCYFKMISEEGGIHGRKLKLLLRDDGYQPPRTKAAVKEMINHGVFAFVGGVGTATGMAVLDDIMEEKIPWVGMATGSSHWAYPLKRNIFATYPNYIDEAYILTQYAVETLDKKRIAFFYQNDDYGKEGLRGAEKYLKQKGMALTASVPVEMLDTDLSSHAIKLKASGADAVILWILPKHGAIMLGTAAKLGFQPQWLTSSTLSDYQLMWSITKGLWNGMIFGNFGLLPDSDHPVMLKYRKAYETYRLSEQERWGIFFYAGFLFAEPLVEGIRRAGRDLTREKLVESMETLKDFQGISGPITFTKDDHQGLKSVFLSKTVGKKMVIEGEEKAIPTAARLSDWISVPK
jgi:ABC-type branched-subunit amino acid transport system substrate-binding protein